MKIFFSIVILSWAIQSYGQPTYQAMYSYQIESDYKNAENKLKQYDSYNSDRSILSYNFLDSSIIKNDTTIPDEIIKNYFIELTKFAANNLRYIYLCSPTHIKQININPKVQYLNDVSTHSAFKFDTSANSFSSILNLSTMVLTKYSYNLALQTESIQAFRIDTTEQQFYNSGRTKKINKWLCKEYKSLSYKNNDVSIWATEELPDYLNPQVYIQDIKAGIVMIEFANHSSIILNEVSITSEKILANDTLRDKLSTCDLLDIFIRKL